MMGEVAEMIVEGLLCQFCGVLIDGDASGYPRCCAECMEDADGIA